MHNETYRFEFEESVELDEAELTLQLAFMATEGLFGESRVRLEGSYDLDERHRHISLAAEGEVGTTAARIYAGLLLREMGPDSFTVRKEASREVSDQRTPGPPAVPAATAA